MPDRRDDEDLLCGQPHGRKASAGRLLGPGTGYRHPGGGNAPLARYLRIARRRPQAILKITRYGHGGNKILSHAHYIQRHGRLALEDENGERIEHPRELRERVQLWVEQAGVRMGEPGEERQRKRRVTAHFILDAGAAAPPEKLSKAAREFLAERFGKDGHEYLFVRHDDTKQPHVHVILNLSNARGRRLRTSVPEVQAWREQFAEIARRNGIDVDASRAWERGKAQTKSRGFMRYGAPRPARWTREQVRRGLAARKQKLLSEAALAAAHGDRVGAASLRSKAATLRMRTDDKTVRRVAAEGRSGAAIKPWELARSENARRVRTAFQHEAKMLEGSAGKAADDERRAVLKRAANELRKFANAVRPTATRAQVVASSLQRSRAVDASRNGQESER